MCVDVEKGGDKTRGHSYSLLLVFAQQIMKKKMHVSTAACNTKLITADIQL